MRSKPRPKVFKVGPFESVDADVFKSSAEIEEWFKTGKLPEPK